MFLKDLLFLFISFGSCICVTGQIRECRMQGGDTLACDNKIPALIPNGVSRVLLEFVSANQLFKGFFAYHATWEHITYLDITAKYTDIYGHYDFQLDWMRFWHLRNLKELKVHGDGISRVNVDAFRQIHNLSVLEFSNCRYLDFKTLVESLLSVNVTIDTLSINDVSTGIGQTIYINDIFFELIRNKNVKCLSLRNSVISMTMLKATENYRLKELDISDVTILLNGLHQMKFYDMIARTLQELTTLNASNNRMHLFLPDPDFLKDRNITGCSNLCHDLIRILFLRLENLYLNKIFEAPIKLVINNTLLNISDCEFTLKRWHFRNNRLQYVNMTVILPVNNTLVDIDFSNNEIVYISSSTTRALTSLETFDLDRNKLNNMETLPEFEDLFVNLVALKDLSLAENEFLHLPQNLLRNNQALQSLDLSGNFLTTLTISLKHLKSLRLLELSRNRIKFLESSKLANVQLFSKGPSSADSNLTARIELAGNPLECSCESSKFLNWLIMVKRRHSNKRYFCSLENENVEINEDTLRRAKFLCIRTTVIVCSIVSIFVLTVFIPLLALFIRRIKRHKKQIQSEKAFLNALLKDALGEKYLCYISYASEDERCVLDEIYTKLGFALTTLVGTRRDFICIGDKDYCLGRPIVDEIFRCISESCVMLFVISEPFCKSHWCEMELREALELKKPIILIFKEHIKEDMMSNVLRTIFNRLTRAKLVENDRAYELVPDWKNLGESIIKLATEKYMTKEETILFESLST